MGKSVVTRQASERELGHDYPSQVRQNQLQLAAEARQQVVSIDLLSLEEETREVSEREEHLLKISLPWWALAFLARKQSIWQPDPEALTKGGEIEGQVRVGAPAPEGDAVQGALHGVSVVTGQEGLSPGGGCAAADTPDNRLSRPPFSRRDPRPAAQRVGTAGRASP